MRLSTHTIVAGLTAVFLLAVAAGAGEAGASDGSVVVRLATVMVASGLNKPVCLTSPAGDTSRLYIVEQQTGRIRIIKNGALLTSPFLDIGARIKATGSEQGLLSLVFHPDYQTNGYFYVNYTDLSGAVAVSRFSVSSGNPDSAVSASELILLIIPEPEANHNGGTLLFGPNDGYLYIGLGDGGGSGDNHGTIGNGQDTATLLGKILRIDVDGGSPYAIPANNPFVGRPGADEIWAYGLRNPWRMSFDRATGDLYIGDVGQDLWEEIDFQPSFSPGGVNYGWRLMEGNHCFNPLNNCDPGGLTRPITEYSHAIGCSVIGGYVYRGCQIPELRGTYFYADYCTGRIWSFRYNGTFLSDSTERTAQLDPPGSQLISQVSSFGEDARGELYILDIADGEVYKIISADSVQPDCPTSNCCLLPGDASGDGAVNVGDAVFTVNFIFRGGIAPSCGAAADVNSDCALNVGDAVYIVNYIFRAGPAPICGGCS